MSGFAHCLGKTIGHYETAGAPGSRRAAGNLIDARELNCRPGFAITGLWRNRSSDLGSSSFDCSRREMREQIGYCWHKAAEYAARAEEASDKETRELFIRFRNWWTSAAESHDSSRPADAAKAAPSWASSRTPELGTGAWHTRPSDGLTSTSAERLGAG